MSETLSTIETPALVLDRSRVVRNIDRLRTRLDALGVALRPHLKTAKSIDVARLAQPDLAGPVTVSTLKEADEFAAAGWRDILYAVGIVPSKFAHVQRLIESGARLTVVLDNVSAANDLRAFAQARGFEVGVLVEIDCDGHRSGLRPDEPDLLAVAAAVQPDPTQAQGTALRGVMTHAGASYASFSTDAKITMAEQERAASVHAARRLREAGYAAPVVSVGSTPTAHFAASLEGVTEVRAGVFVMFDLVMAGLGVCGLDDIAMSVAATVIGHQKAKGWIIVDAGWMAMSRDRGTAKQPVDQGYGVVCDTQGQPLRDLIMGDANQEHGVLTMRPGSQSALPDLPVGSVVRILPNHACATGAQHDAYLVVEGTSAAPTQIQATWPRFRGW
jgi:D-serine deaminase-like pyridoxal phosphate-dependent protein